jgi:DNA-binding XRE family transcriptional regulator
MKSLNCRIENLNRRESVFEISGPVGILSMRIKTRLSARERRAVAIAFFRQIRPFLEYFRTGRVHHFDGGSFGFRRGEERGVNVFRSASLGSAGGILGFEIRVQRLKKGWSQSELAQRAHLSHAHVSKIERGLCIPHSLTIRRLEFLLETALPMPQKNEKNKTAQGKVKLAGHRFDE